MLEQSLAYRSFDCVKKGRRLRALLPYMRVKHLDIASATRISLSETSFVSCLQVCL